MKDPKLVEAIKRTRTKVRGLEIRSIPVVVLLVCVTAYVLAHVWLASYWGKWILVLSPLPALVAGWLLGMRTGLASSVVIIVINVMLVTLKGEMERGPDDWQALAISSVAVLVCGAFAGRVGDLRTSLQKAQERSKLAVERLVKETELSASLATLGTALLSASSVESVASLVLAHAKSLTNSPLGCAGLIEKRSRRILCLAHEPGRPDWCRSCHDLQGEGALTGLCAWAERNRQPLMANRAPQDTRVSELLSVPVPFSRLLSVPAEIDYALGGQVTVAGAPQAYGERDLAVVERLTGLFAMAVRRQRLHERLHYLSHHDPLTGLYNRTYFEEEMVRMERGRLFPVSVVVVDVDDLKATNDTLGHSAGDELLQRAASVLRAVFRAEDVVSRVGGDEFAVLLPGVDAGAAEEAVVRIRTEVDRDNRERKSSALSLSVGTGTVRKGDPLRQAMKQADDRMYLDKLSRQPRGKETQESERLDRGQLQA